LPKLPKDTSIDEVYYYGTGMRNPDNVKMVKKSLRKVFTEAQIDINDDMLAAARALMEGARDLPATSAPDLSAVITTGKRS